MNRNVVLYRWFVIAVSSTFWLPVFFLYFSRQLPLERVLQLEAVYYVAVFLLEVPSGYASDRLGRRPTLIAAAVWFLIGYALFALADGFVAFAVAQVFLAGGFAFISGTDSAFLFDSLRAAGRESEFAPIEASATSIGALASAIAALIGGAVGLISLRAVYLLSAVAALFMLVVTVMFREPVIGDDDDEHHAGGPLAHVGRCLLLLRRPQLRWLFAFAVIAYAFNHVPYELYQPYTSLALDTFGESADLTPLITGMLTALIMVGRSVSARVSVAFRDRVGLHRCLLLSLALQLAIITVCGTVLHPIVLLLLLGRSIPTGLQKAPLSTAVNERIGSSVRATYLSLQTLAGRLLFAVMLLSLSVIVGDGAVSWPALSSMALACGGGGVVILVVLAGTARVMIR